MQAGRLGLLGRLGDLQVGTGTVGAGDEPEEDRFDGALVAVLEVEAQGILSALHEAESVAPCIDLSGAAEGFPRSGSAILAGVVDESDGDVEVALQRAQQGEDGGDSARIVFVEGVQADERIEQEEAGPVHLNGPEEAVDVAEHIELEGRFGDEAQIEGVELDSTMASHAVDALPGAVEAVFGEVGEDGTRLLDREGAEARSAGSDTQGEVESEPGLARLRLCGAPHNRSHGAHPFMWSEPS